MPVFFFDIHIGTHQGWDEDGQEMASPEAARVEAIRTLQELATHVIPQAARVEYTADVRDGQRKVIFTATRLRRGGWPSRTRGAAKGGIKPLAQG
jgi:hypothetical protein